MFLSRMTAFTSVIEPSTKIFRVVSPPGGEENFSLFPKQVPRTLEAQGVAKTRTIRKMAENRSFEMVHHIALLNIITIVQSIPGR